jgi:hypothetical protein
MLSFLLYTFDFTRRVFMSNMLKRERQTISAMISMYCAGHHSPEKGGLCRECAALEAYAMEKIDRCPFTVDKPACKKCPIHCYSPEKREQVRAIMRFAGPKMLLAHPVLTFFHLVDGLKKPKKALRPPKRG